MNRLKNTTDQLTQVTELLNEIHAKLGLIYDQLGDLDCDDSIFYQLKVRPTVVDLRQRIEMILGDLSVISYDIDLMVRKCTDLDVHSNSDTISEFA